MNNGANARLYRNASWAIMTFGATMATYVVAWCVLAHILKREFDVDALIIIATYAVLAGAVFWSAALVKNRRRLVIVVAIILFNGIIVAGTVSLLAMWALGKLPTFDAPKIYMVPFMLLNAVIIIAYVWAVASLLPLRRVDVAPDNETGT